MEESRTTMDRRSLFRVGAIAAGGAGLGWSAAALTADSTTAQKPVARGGATPTPVEVMPQTAAAARTVPFYGANQAGISTPAQAEISLIGLDLGPEVDRAGLARLMRLLSDDASRLAQGKPALADTEPELALSPAGLTITFGFGPRICSWLGAEAAVEPLPDFETDRLDEAWGQTDLAIQICADDPLTIAHARRMLLKDCRSYATVRWIQDGYRRALATDNGSAMRNLMGQVDETVNPSEADPNFAGLIWRDSPGYRGGTTMVVRRIRTELDTWDEVDRPGREAAVGRKLDTGAPLTGEKETDEADFDAVDEVGLPIIDPASHIARARHLSAEERFRRRSYNYTIADASQSTGEDSGMLFIAFCADASKQFVPVQQRLAEMDRLNLWVTTIGSAIYTVPPGVSEGGVIAADLLGV